MIIATMGLPRSGKSTWCDEQKYPIICPDDFRLGVHGETWNGVVEPFVWACVWAATRALLLRHDVIVFDATNTTRKRRDELRKCGEVCFRVFGTSREECLKRGKPHMANIIIRMSDAWEDLGDDEGRWPPR